MTIQKRLAAALEGTALERPRGLKSALAGCDLDLDKLELLLADPGSFPYGRTRLHEGRGAEVLLMNWAPGRKCAPHDHGGAWGVIKILEGEVEHSVYKLDERGNPRLRLMKRFGAGRWLFAPKDLVHSMANPTDRRLVTLHAYVPSIAGMRVYDPARCVSCIVAGKCGAWWPTEAHQLIQLNSHQ